MTHRIIKAEPLKNFVVSITFQNGTKKAYDIKNLFIEFPQFMSLKDDILFEKVIVDVGGYGISWNDDLDISAEELWENGLVVEEFADVDIMHVVGYQLTNARKKAGVTQKELAEKINMYQADISKIERGLGNPSIETLQKLADGLGAKLKVEFKV